MVDIDFICDSQQTLGCLGKKTKPQDFTPIDDSYQPSPPPNGFRVSGESTSHVAFDVRSTLMSAEARYLLVEDFF